MSVAGKPARRIAAALAILALAFGAWHWWRGADGAASGERYRFGEVIAGDLVQTVNASGTLNPVVLVNVGTQVSGTVRRLFADFNDRVHEGQVLLELDPTTFNAAVAQSEGEVANADAALRLARAEEKRMRELFAQEYVSRQELDKAIQSREAAAAQLKTAQGKLARDRANLGYSVIRSPVAGVVVSRQVNEGQTVAASFQTPTLYQIAQDLARMQIDSNVAEADIGKVREGQGVTFTVDAYPGRRFEGQVRQIRLNPILQQNVVTYNVVVGVDNADGTLLPGMTAYISIAVDRRDAATLLPNAALRYRPRGAEDSGGESPGRAEKGARRAAAGERGVYILRDGKLERVALRTGISDGRHTEVIGGGLKPGDRVVVDDQLSETGPTSARSSFRFRAL
jgi:HlyD family secretion protein